jgi:hypothetical protein
MPGADLIDVADLLAPEAEAGIFKIDCSVEWQDGVKVPKENMQSALDVVESRVHFAWFRGCVWRLRSLANEWKSDVGLDLSRQRQEKGRQ